MFFYILVPGETTRKSNKCPEYGKMGDPLTMECPVEGNPRPNITWALGGKSLSSDRSSITVTHQITGEHRYTCTADNGIGEPDNSTFLLVVNRKFLTVTYSMSTVSEYKFKCSHKFKCRNLCRYDEIEVYIFKVARVEFSVS